VGSSEPARREFFATRTIPTITDEWIEKPTNMTDTNTQKELQGRIAELEAEISILRQQKKYGLVWEDKLEDVVTQCDTHVPVLSEVSSKRLTDKTALSDNILIEGDNYHALSVLNYTHRNNVDFIYIDPPYNTGARDWRYNNDYVDSEDTYRHTKWASFMYKRLRLAKNLLKEDGIICVTIDDYELPRLLMLMEEVFQESNHLGTVVIRNNPKGRMTQRKFSLVHEYGVFFGKTDKAKIKKLPVNPEEKSHNYKQDEDGSWYLPVNLRKQGVDSNAVNKNGKLSERYFSIYFSPKTGEVSTSKKLEVEITPIDSSGQKRIWRRAKQTVEEMFNNGDLIVKETKNGFQIYFKFRGGLDGKLAQSIWTDSRFSASDHGTRLLDKILDERELFQYPKAPEAVKESILASCNDKNAVIVDFFAGSGTTGHAVLELNKQDGGNRQFILCTNNENKIAEEVTYPRVKKVIKGYGDVAGLGGSLRYYKTKLVDVEKLQKVPDDKRLSLTYQAGEMIALRENTFDETEKNDWWQIFSSETKTVAIYFQEDKQKLRELVAKLSDQEQVVLYVFSWSKNEYTNEFAEYTNIRVEDIPEPIIEVYKEINRLK